MSGLRIHHPTLRNAVLRVPVPAKSARGVAKDIHVTIDGDGYALVSEGVWGELQRAKVNGANHTFIIVNEVRNPPTIRVGDGVEDHRRTYRQESAALRELAPVGLTARVVETPINVRSHNG